MILDNDRTPVVAYEDRGPLAAPIQETAQIPTQRNDVVVLDRRGRGTAAVSAHVGSEHPIASRNERWHLPAPRERQLGETVAEHNERSIALVDDVQLNPVDRNKTLAHGAEIT
jgi:hypothetical protein